MHLTDEMVYYDRLLDIEREAIAVPAERVKLRLNTNVEKYVNGFPGCIGECSALVDLERIEADLLLFIVADTTSGIVRGISVTGT